MRDDTGGRLVEDGKRGNIKILVRDSFVDSDGAQKTLCRNCGQAIVLRTISRMHSDQEVSELTLASKDTLLAMLKVESRLIAKAGVLAVRNIADKSA